MTEHQKNRSYIVGVAGGSGSGKSTVVQELMERVGPQNSVVLHHDSYYRDSSELSLDERAKINFDHPDSLETDLLAEHVRTLLAGQPIYSPVYDFTTHRRVQEMKPLHPKPIVIVEGILVLAEPGLRELMDLKIFVDADADLRFIRRMQRDVEVRGRSHESVVKQYLATVKPMHEQFVDPSKRFADLIVPEGGYNRVAISVLTAKIRAMLASFAD